MSFFYLIVIILLWYLFFSLVGIDFPPRSSLFKRASNEKKYKSFVEYLLQSQKKGLVPEYKFFGFIVERLLSYQKKYGINIDSPCREIRQAAQKDMRESKRVREEFLGLIFQYMLISGFTWFFIFNVQISLGIHFKGSYLLFLLIWQISGISLGVFLFYFTEKKLFKIFYPYFYTAYIFRSLIRISRPVSEVVKVSKLNCLEKKDIFKFIHERFFSLVSGLKTQGQLPMDELSNIINELWDVYEDQFTKFHKLILALKLGLILLFVFPGFLFAIFLSMERLVF